MMYLNEILEQVKWNLIELRFKLGPLGHKVRIKPKDQIVPTI